MKRRDFLLTSAALMATPALAADLITYAPGLVAERLAKGETVLLDFKASWCSTCAAQERVIDALRNENPAYDKAISFVAVDWDEYGKGRLAKDLKIPRRSTLVLLRGEDELGRIVAGTGKAQIQALLDLALA